MKTPSLAAALALPAVLLASPPAVVEGVEEGEQVSYTFQKAPLGSLGITTLEELKGKPVLIDFWGTR